MYAQKILSRNKLNTKPPDYTYPVINIIQTHLFKTTLFPEMLRSLYILILTL